MANISINKGWFNRMNGTSAVNKMTYLQLLEELRSIRYEEYYSSIGGNDARDERVERGPFPHFVKVFYDQFTMSGHIPTPKMVCEAYHELYCEDIGDGYSRLMANGFSFHRNDLYGRITRAYCSWCRELTLLYALFETLHFGYVAYYDLSKDMKGVDIVIVHGKHRYNVHSYLRSKRSEMYRAEKDSRYEKADGIHFEVVASELNTTRVGDINVHGKDNALWLLGHIQHIENQVG